MKTAFYVVIAFIALFLSAVSCTGNSKNKYLALDKAEEAYARGVYQESQSIVDSLMLKSDLAEFGVDELCRMSLLFAHLGDGNGNVDINTAMAARALSAAFALDSDSTISYISRVSLDDRAYMAIIIALTTAGSDPDSLIVEPDSMY